MANPRIWYLPEERRFWMDRADPLITARFVRQYPRAIHTTNAYDVLPAETIRHLREEAEADTTR